MSDDAVHSGPGRQSAEFRCDSLNRSGEMTNFNNYQSQILSVGRRPDVPDFTIASMLIWSP